MSNPLGALLRRRLDDWSVEPPNQTLAVLQRPIWNLLCDYYFRLEVDGWERLPDGPCLLVGVHSGAALTMDSWTFVYAWWRRFGTDRVLHGTAHDILMATPGLGDYFRAMGVVPASRKSVTAGLAAGHDVMVWPGGEQDSMRSWTRRDDATLAGRRGFVRQALRSQVPIVPVASVGGHDTVFVVSEGRWLAKLGGLGSKLRAATAPLVVGPPFGIALETIPMHLPLPAKIRTEILDPVFLEGDADRENDEEYVEKIYDQIEATLQAGMDGLAAKRTLPVFF
ncbi:MAG TPA: lysophospholipid acyltransferase family protein [Mycobacteriales bacterium]|nr:lysophospholipid acyltransferase family protein [Mycobacteriales bacterium]